MSFRDDSDALLARLAALDAQVASHDRDLATRDQALATAQDRITELESQVAELQRSLGDSQAAYRDLRKRRTGRDTPEEVSFAPGTPEAQAEAERCLAAGIAKHNAGDRNEATRLFARGLDAAPGHPELMRALRRYT